MKFPGFLAPWPGWLRINAGKRNNCLRACFVMKIYTKLKNRQDSTKFIFKTILSEFPPPRPFIPGPRTSHNCGLGNRDALYCSGKTHNSG